MKQSQEWVRTTILVRQIKQLSRLTTLTQKQELRLNLLKSKLQDFDHHTHLSYF